MTQTQPTAAPGARPRPQPDPDAVATLMALRDRHPYQRVVDRTYKPKVVRDLDVWEAARVLAIRLLADDRPRHQHGWNSLASRRANLCIYLYWLARHDPDALTVERALVEPRVARRVNSDMDGDRERAYESRKTAKTVVMSFRKNYAVLVPPPSRIAGVRKTDRLPTPDEDFQGAVSALDMLHRSTTRRHCEAVLILARGAGLDNDAIHHVTRADIRTIPRAGTWVFVPETARYPGAVPVFPRFVPRLRALARRGDQSLTLLSDKHFEIGTYDRASHQVSNVNRVLRDTGQPYRVNIDSMRLAWFVEHFHRNTPILSLVRASRQKTLRGIVEAIHAWAPTPSDDPARFAADLGAVNGQVTTWTG